MKMNFTLLLILVSTACFSQESWNQQSSLAGNPRSGAFYFSIGNKGYVGTGAGASGFTSDFWEFDPFYNTWTQKADFGGGVRGYATGFSVGDKGYAGTGIVASYNWRQDMWEYDTTANAWTMKDNYPGGLRYGLASFSIGNKGYSGTGEYRIGPWTISTYYNDFYEFDPSALPGHQWTRKADVPEQGRTHAAGMSIGNKGYIGFGVYYYDTRKNDLWEYDPGADTWTRKADLPAVGRYRPALFSIGNKGYVMGGQYYSQLNDFWEFNPNVPNDIAWTRKQDLPADGRSFGVGMTIGNRGYAGFGTNNIGSLNDWWEYRTYPVTMTCPPDTIVSTSSGCAAVVNGLDPVYSPAGENPLLTYQVVHNGLIVSSGLGSVSGKTFNLGTSYVTYQLPNWAQLCSFTVTVTDDPPVLTCPADVSYYKNETNTYSISELSAFDNCGIAEITYEITGATTRNGTGTNASGIFNLGVSQITWNVKDINNNTSTCTLSVTILVETFPTITICNQTWMQKNLNVTKYRNGDPIPQVTSAAEWSSLTTGAWSYYNNDPATEVTYGKLYNWYAVNDPRGLAPEGWHIPDNGEWIELENCAGDYSHAAGPLKEAGTIHWTDPNAGATNATGFTALPGGMRSGGGSYLALRDAGNWWSTNSGQYSHYGIPISGGYYRSMFYASEVFFGNPSYYGYPSFPIADFKTGMSVRCVQDVPPSFTSCPSDQTIYSTSDSCGREVFYDATATGNPTPQISYSFTGATSESGAGTGSGKIFNAGTTTVILYAAFGSDTATCTFTIRVLDTIHPVISCPPAQNLCYQSGNNYTIPVLTASDNCGIQSITYTISGATARNGNSANASGIFNPGISTIRWSVLDYAGNVTVCTTIVKVNRQLTVTLPDTYPLFIWGNANTLYKGFGPTCALVTAIPSGGTPYPGLNGYRYAWSNGATSFATFVCPPSTPGSYTFTVTITDAAGCTVTASKTIKVIDVRCGPNNSEITICWLGRYQSCVSTWQAILAMYYGGARLGPCSQYSATGMEPLTKIQETTINEKTRITVFPNPATQGFNINIVSPNNDQVQLRIYDAVGKAIEQQKGPANKTYSFGQQYRPGIYYVEVQQGKEKNTIKVIKL